MKIEKEMLVAGELRIGFLKKNSLSGLLNNQLDNTLSSVVLVTATNNFSFDEIFWTLSRQLSIQVYCTASYDIILRQYSKHWTLTRPKLV